MQDSDIIVSSRPDPEIALRITFKQIRLPWHSSKCKAKQNNKV